LTNQVKLLGTRSFKTKGATQFELESKLLFKLVNRRRHIKYR